MIKKILTLLFLISIITTVLALDEPQIPGADKVEDLEEQINNIPLDDSGNIDQEKFQPIKTKIEEKIGEINLWLEENASWMKAVFGMVPSFTVAFIINLWLVVFFFIILVTNSNGLFAFIDTLNKKIDMGLLEPTWGNILGLSIFLILHVTKTISALSTVLTDQIFFLFQKVIPIGIATNIIATIIIIIIFIALLFFAPEVLNVLAKKAKESRDKKTMEGIEQTKEQLERIAKGATQSS